MCAVTFFCLHIYIYIYIVCIFSLSFMMFAALLALLDVTVSSTHIGRFFFQGCANGWPWCMRMHGLNHSSLESKFPFNAKLPNVCINAQST